MTEHGIYLSLPGFDKKMTISIATPGTGSAMDKPRTLEEIKSDIRSRVGHRAPFNHADKEEAEEVLSKLNSVDGEVWAGAWNELGARWPARRKPPAIARRRSKLTSSHTATTASAAIRSRALPANSVLT